MGGLWSLKDRKASALSGGMRRRLSVAIAAVGNSKLILLDEPTTGLDPYSRHQMWTVINATKRDAAIILTTHAMDEADMLSDRIGIMVKGQMCCLGEQQHLKNRFASSYQLTVSCKATQLEEVVELITRQFPQCTPTHKLRGTCAFSFAKGTVPAKVYQEMEILAHNNPCILDWCFNQASLEELFQRMVREAHNDNTT